MTMAGQGGSNGVHALSGRAGLSGPRPVAKKVTIELRKFALDDAKYVSTTVTRTACVG